MIRSFKFECVMVDWMSGHLAFQNIELFNFHTHFASNILDVCDIIFQVFSGIYRFNASVSLSFIQRTFCQGDNNPYFFLPEHDQLLTPNYDALLLAHCTNALRHFAVTSTMTLLKTVLYSNVPRIRNMNLRKIRP